MILYLPEKSVCAMSISSLSEGRGAYIYPLKKRRALFRGIKRV
jgi:hypothetical protein